MQVASPEIRAKAEQKSGRGHEKDFEKSLKKVLDKGFAMW